MVRSARNAVHIVVAEINSVFYLQISNDTLRSSKVSYPHTCPTKGGQLHSDKAKQVPKPIHFFSSEND